MRGDAWDAGAEPDRGYRSGGASVGVLELADRVVGALQPATKLPSSRRGTQGLQHRGAAWAWAGCVGSCGCVGVIVGGML